MGEAFDRAGHFLGSAEGATKREVFDKLQEQFKDAAEIRIRTIESDGGASAEMPRYKCHKEVHALKITAIRMAPADQERMHADGDWYLDVEAPFAAICVGHDFIIRHKPTIGGYYVVYEDGYKSFSPADAFEGGYTRI